MEEGGGPLLLRWWAEEEEEMGARRQILKGKFPYNNLGCNQSAMNGCFGNGEEEIKGILLFLLPPLSLPEKVSLYLWPFFLSCYCSDNGVGDKGKKKRKRPFFPFSFSLVPITLSFTFLSFENVQR